jgi:uncharacterized protein DUF6297
VSVAPAEATSAEAASVAAVRSFIRGHRRSSWLDWYAIAFAVVLVCVLLSDFLAEPFSRLTAHAGAGIPAQTAAGAALVVGAAAGLLMLGQAFGPLALPPADAFWLLLSPLDRRAVLLRPAAATAAISALAGGLLGVLGMAMAAPYLRPGEHHLVWVWLLLAAISGAGFFLAAVGATMLAQPWQRWRARLRAACVAVAVAAAIAAVTAERWTAMSRTVTTWFAEISTGAVGVFAAAGLAAACAAAILVWRMLPRFPADVLWTDSARVGTTRMAVAFLNLPLLTWIAEDNHWRGRLLVSRPWPRLLVSRPWPRLSPAFALAWADWRRLARRPALLVAVVVSTLAPALAGAAVTGHARGWTTAAALLAGAIAAGTQGTTATRRDTNDPTLRRLLGVSAGEALAARAVLPALLSAAWLTLALALLVSAGVLRGWLWPLLGPVAGPGVAAAALRVARTAPINPAEQGPDTPIGSAPQWLITRAFSVLIGLVGAYPALKAVLAGQVHGGTFAAQMALSAIVLGGYLMLVSSPRRS